MTTNEQHNCAVSRVCTVAQYAVLEANGKVNAVKNFKF